MGISAPPSGQENSMMALVTDDEDTEELLHDLSGEAEEMQRLNSVNTGENRRGRSVTLGTTPDSENLKPRAVVRTREFWTLWFTFFLNTQAITYINSMYKAYGQTFINDDHLLSLVGAIAAIFNATGRIFWGHLCDKFGYKACMMFITVAIAVLYSTFIF